MTAPERQPYAVSVSGRSGEPVFEASIEYHPSDASFIALYLGRLVEAGLISAATMTPAAAPVHPTELYAAIERSLDTPAVTQQREIFSQAQRDVRQLR